MRRIRGGLLHHTCVLRMGSSPEVGDIRALLSSIADNGFQKSQILVFTVLKPPLPPSLTFDSVFCLIVHFHGTLNHTV